MSDTPLAMKHPTSPSRRIFQVLWNSLKMPALAIVTAFIIGAIVIWVTSGSLASVGEAYYGLIRGAFIKQRAFSESLVATTPYIFLSLGLAVGFKTGLFNIGVEGQFYLGSIGAAWAGQAFPGLPAIILLPLALIVGALAGAIWAAIPGYLKARTGAHEVISTMMMNYIAFRFTEYIVSGPLKDRGATAVQTPRVSSQAEIWTLADIPARLQDPLNALGVALFFVILALIVTRAVLKTKKWSERFNRAQQRWIAYLGVSAIVFLFTFFLLPLLTHLWWPFQDQYDRMHIGLFLALLAAVGVWWLLEKTTLGFELRTVGSNPNAARYAGANITRNIVIAMALSGALAGLAGAIEVLGVSICRCFPLFFSSGYGWDSIGIALLAKNNPFGIIAASFLWGSMRNGADLMELNSGVSKYIISLLQALVLLFVAAPDIVRWIYRIKARPQPEITPLTLEAEEKK